MMEDDNGESNTFQTPSRAQELALAVLPIPSAFLSIIGSSIIIFMSVSTRRQRKWTPYTRLLLCLSFYDVIASVTLGMASFLRNKDISTRPFSFGTSGTCTIVGFFNQLSFGTLIYHGSLSFYFLLTARFGYSNAYIARVIEPWMHIAGNGFATITSVIAVALGAYDEMADGSGCWVANYPRGCGEGPDCISRLMGWLYFGLPSILIFALVLIFNSMIFIFVRRQKIPLKLPKPEAETARDGGSFNADGNEECPGTLQSIEEKKETNESPLETCGHESKATAPSRDQARRLRLVSTQAFLYVAFFLMCTVWTAAVRLIEARGNTREEEMQLLVDNYVVYLLQAVFAPLQGLFNMAVFIRPKLYLCAAAFPRESRLWIVRRTILGNRVKPTRSSHRPLGTTDGQRGSHPMNDKRQKEIATNEHVVARLPRHMISSITTSEGDFDSEILASKSTDERWSTKKETGFSSILTSLPIRLESMRNPKSSVLEVISEDETSNFEHTSRISLVEEVVMEMSKTDFSPWNSERRWASDSSNPLSMSSDSGPMSMPRREGSIVDEADESSSFRHLNQSSSEKKLVPLPVDQPMKVPQRHSTADLTSSERKAQEPENDNKRDEDTPIKVPVRRKSLG